MMTDEGITTLLDCLVTLGLFLFVVIGLIYIIVILSADWW